MNVSLFKARFILINPLIGLILLFATVLANPKMAIANIVATPQHTAKTSQESNFERGKAAYQAGRYTEAQTLWEQAYKQAHNPVHKAKSLNYLALTNHKLGALQKAQTDVNRALDLVQQSNFNSDLLKAQILNTKGRIELSMGKAEAALASWQQAAKIYAAANDEVGVLGVKINQVQAWQDLGLYRRAQKSLEQIAEQLESQSDSSLKITGWRNLGIALQVTGDLDLAESILNRSLALSQKLNLAEESSMTLFNLGNVALASENPDRAIDLYRQTVATTSQPRLKTEALLNQLGLLISQQQWQRAASLLPAVETSFSNISTAPNRKLVYLQVNLAKSLIQLNSHQADAKYSQTSQRLLNKAIAQAQQLKDPQAESYALGMLGHFYESTQQISLGSKYTQQAVQLAQVINNADLTYQWQWQLGRLLDLQGNHQGAIASYTEAVNAVESLRSDLVITNTDMQFSFRESIEPVYRQLVSLLLTSENNRPVSQDNLIQARNTIESLQIAELNNFFKEACIDVTPTDIDSIDSKAAVVYPIILRDRLEIIVSLPDKSLRHYSQAIPQSELEPVIEELRQTLQIRSRRTFFSPAQELYSLIIAPILQDLNNSQIETIVFIPDGSLRNIPLGALHDGKQYLLEQYNVAITPGLQLLAPAPLKEVELKTLAAGITQQRRGFSSLKFVNQELTDIQNRTDSVVLRDDKFTQSNFKNQITTANYPIVHIATHGQFSSELEDTFLLAWDEQIQIGELEELLVSTDAQQRRAIELLILSACETARGDDRAALGLAGMAVKAGARTTLATLWTVYDESTALTMNHFYQNITQTDDKPNKANALRQAQLELLNSRNFSHPYYWAAFMMVGNWL